MKTTHAFAMIILSSLSAFGAFAETKIEFPLVAEEVANHDVKPVRLSSLNAKLKEKGLPAFPAKVVLGKSDVAWAKELIRRTTAAGRALHRDLYLFQYGTDGLYMYQVPEPFCYRGNPGDVPGIIDALMGVVFQQDQGIQAVRYGTKKFIHPTFKDDFFETSEEARESDEEYNPGEVAMWRKYDTRSDTVLVMSDLGPQGDGVELYATEIKRCR